MTKFIQGFYQDCKETIKKKEKELILIGVFSMFYFLLVDKPYFNLILKTKFFIFVCLLVVFLLLRFKTFSCLLIAFFSLGGAFLALLINLDIFYSLMGLCFYVVLLIVVFHLGKEMLRELKSKK